MVSVALEKFYNGKQFANNLVEWELETQKFDVEQPHPLPGNIKVGVIITNLQGPAQEHLRLNCDLNDDYERVRQVLFNYFRTGRIFQPQQANTTGGPTPMEVDAIWKALKGKGKGKSKGKSKDGKGNGKFGNNNNYKGGKGDNKGKGKFGNNNNDKGKGKGGHQQQGQYYNNGFNNNYNSGFNRFGPKGGKGKGRSSWTPLPQQQQLFTVQQSTIEFE